MIDLDALDQKLASSAGQDLIAESPIGELLPALVAELRAAREVVEFSRTFAGPVGDGWHDQECTPDYGPDEPEKCYEHCPNPWLTTAIAIYDEAVGS